MRLYAWLLMVFVMLASCKNESPTNPTTAVPIVSGPVDVKTYDFAPLVIQNGDLPQQRYPRELIEEIPARFDVLPPPERVFNQSLSSMPDDDNPIGGVTVLIYADPATAQTAFNAIKPIIADPSLAEETPAIGDATYILSGKKGRFDSLEWVEGVTVQCRAVIWAYLSSTEDADLLRTYFTRVLDRFKPATCP